MLDLREKLNLGNYTKFFICLCLGFSKFTKKKITVMKVKIPLRIMHNIHTYRIMQKLQYSMDEQSHRKNARIHKHTHTMRMYLRIFSEKGKSFGITCAYALIMCVYTYKSIYIFHIHIKTFPVCFSYVE